MANANRQKHDAAHDRIARGLWVADVEAGTISNPAGRVLGSKDDKGYVVYKIYIKGTGHNGKHDRVLAHRVLWEHGHGPLADDIQINHINGLKDDNRAANLEPVTAAGNVQHAHRTGLAWTPPKGEQCPWAKITAADVGEIRRRARAGERQREIAQDYGLSRGYVSLVVTRRRWGTV